MGEIITRERKYICYDCNCTVILKKSMLRKMRRKGFPGVYCSKCGKQIRQNEIKDF